LFTIIIKIICGILISEIVICGLVQIHKIFNFIYSQKLMTQKNFGKNLAVRKNIFRKIKQ